MRVHSINTHSPRRNEQLRDRLGSSGGQPARPPRDPDNPRFLLSFRFFDRAVCCAVTVKTSIYNKNFDSALTRKAESDPIPCPLASGIWASSVAAEHEAQQRLLMRIGLVARNARVTDSYTCMCRQASQPGFCRQCADGHRWLWISMYQGRA